MDSALALRLPFEMLHGVRQKDLFRVETCFFERAAQQLTSRTHERLALEVFLIAGLLADQHQARLRWSLAEHRLGRALP